VKHAVSVKERPRPSCGFRSGDCSLLLGFVNLFWRLLSGEETIGHTFDIEDESSSSKNPLGGVVLSLELSSEHVRLVSVGGHVAGALVTTLVNLAFNHHSSLAVDNGHDRELSLGNRLFHLSGVLLPSSTFE